MVKTKALTVKAKKPQDPREPNVENVAIDKELLGRIKEIKKKTGVSIRFFVEQALEAKLATQP